MPLEHHPLNREFPQQHDALRKLMQSDARFARLAEEYEALDKRIYEIEDGRSVADDLMLQGLKLQRVGLKDEIADLRAALDILEELNPELTEDHPESGLGGAEHMSRRREWKRDLFRSWHRGDSSGQWPRPEDYGLPPR